MTWSGCCSVCSSWRARRASRNVCALSEPLLVRRANQTQTLGGFGVECIHTHLVSVTKRDARHGAVSIPYESRAKGLLLNSNIHFGDKYRTLLVRQREYSHCCIARRHSDSLGPLVNHISTAWPANTHRVQPFEAAVCLCLGIKYGLTVARLETDGPPFAKRSRAVLLTHYDKFLRVDI